MALSSPPLWMEGMFIRPQHLQQQNRYVETLIERRALALRLFGWGVRSLTLDRDSLRLGRISLTACEAVMPDGTAVSIPGDGPPPPTRDVPAGTRNLIVKLAMPVRSGDGLEVGDEISGRASRYRASEQEVRDSTSAERVSAAIQVGSPRLRLLLDGENEDDTVSLRLARIDQVDAAGAVVLSPTFVPPAVECGAVGRLMEAAREIEGLLHSLGNTLADRVDPSRMVGEMAGVIDYLLLMTINRFEPLLANFSRARGVHPQDFHAVLLQLAGELATFGLRVRRPVSFPPYLHDDIEASLEPILAAIRAGLLIVIDERVVSIALQPRDYGIWLGPLADKSLLRTARFVLAAKSSMPAEALRANFPTQVKLGPVELIRDLVNLQLPGIVLEPLPVAPRELPYYGGYTYFEVSQAGDLWGRMANSSAFALHVGTDFGDLAMELWAIRAARS